MSRLSVKQAAAALALAGIATTVHVALANPVLNLPGPPVTAIRWDAWIGGQFADPVHLTPVMAMGKFGLQARHLGRV